MITNQLLYQLSYTGSLCETITNRKRKYYKIKLVSASRNTKLRRLNIKNECERLFNEKVTLIIAQTGRQIFSL
jgi:hypothetical protein